MEKKTLHYEIFIEAPVEKVWRIMLDEESFKIWTTEFSEGSHYVGSWEEGSEIQFLDPKSGGMQAVIAENREHEFISIKHIAMINNGKPDYEEAKEWAPAFENYTFEAKDGGTLLKVDMDIIEKYIDMFNDMWPRALNKLKELAEK